ncbi:MAG: type II toxin-antitoxin system RelE/ParE family toxin [Planctomycetota bacterium]|nr:type II toxin-antitoxin system RelE/ParE family toxin [Planctomycetota bacterium]
MPNVVITRDAQSQLEELPVSIQTRMEKVFQRLRQWPSVSGAKPLRGDLAGRFRMRTGDYRVQFCVTGNVVTIEKVGHRDGFYEE